MQISENVHRIRIDFQVTESVNRFVYIYLITRKFCYLIDSGVAGSEKIIGEYMGRIGRRLEEIDGIFLTHAHPDHIGGAAAIKRLSDCKIYCSEEERRWTEDIHLQFKERPIPNFYRLAGESVQVEEVVRDGDRIEPEEGLEIKVIEASGHSKGDIAYLLNDQILFTGDAVPAAEDFPIFISWEKSMQTLDKIEKCGADFCCPAWDRVYEKRELMDVLRERKQMLFTLKKAVADVSRQFPQMSETEKNEKIAGMMGWQGGAGNPLFAVSVKGI